MDARSRNRLTAITVLVALLAAVMVILAAPHAEVRDDTSPRATVVSPG